MINLIRIGDSSVLIRFLLLLLCSILNILGFFLLYGKCAEGDLVYADHQS